ncbi:MAG: aspartate aminotransferase family protein [Verrucomicrobia bacterium]|nr:aspartate aminotransferase family protein [Verrucomicrobiota bacterium]
MNTEEIKEKHQKYVMPTYAPGLALVKGRGTRVWDAEDNEYLDFLAGLAVVNIGHCHPNLSKAIARQAKKLMHVSNLYFNEKQPALAEKLSQISLGGKCFFCNSGAEANEALIKLARLWGKSQGRYEVITMKNSFHGRTLATLTATGQDKVQKGFEPLPEGFKCVPYNDLEACRNAIDEKTAAVLVEVVQGEGGVVPADPEYIRGLRALCDEKGILLLCDEVQCGVGRTGKWFGYQNFEITPDAISLAKGLGGGFPIGAVVTAPKLAEVFQPGHHATTFGGTPLACSAALAVLNTIDEEDLLEHACAMSRLMMKKLGKLVEKYEFLERVRGIGLMIGLVLNQPAKDFEKLLMSKRLITLATAGNVIRMLPPLNVKKSEVKKALKIIEEACEEYRKIPDA